MKQTKIITRPDHSWPQALTFQADPRGFVFYQVSNGHHTIGRYYVPDKNGHQPNHGETWVCNRISETARAIIVRPLQRIEELKWGWAYLPDKYSCAGVGKPAATSLQYPWLVAGDGVEEAEQGKMFFPYEVSIPPFVKDEIERLPEMLKFRHAEELINRFLSLPENEREKELGRPTAIILGGNMWNIIYPPVESPGGAFCPKLNFNGTENDASKDWQVVRGSAVRQKFEISVEINAVYSDLISTESIRVPIFKDGRLHSGYSKAAGVAAEIQQHLDTIQAEIAAEAERKEAEIAAVKRRQEEEGRVREARIQEEKRRREAEESAEQQRHEKKAAEDAATLNIKIPLKGKRYDCEFVRAAGCRVRRSYNDRDGNQRFFAVQFVPEGDNWAIIVQILKDGEPDGEPTIYLKDGPFDPECADLSGLLPEELRKSLGI